VKSYPDWDQLERFEATAVRARPNKLSVTLTEIGSTGSARSITGSSGQGGGSTCQSPQVVAG
jgi:hypothetical protein